MTIKVLVGTFNFTDSREIVDAFRKCLSSADTLVEQDGRVGKYNKYNFSDFVLIVNESDQISQAVGRTIVELQYFPWDSIEGFNPLENKDQQLFIKKSAQGLARDLAMKLEVPIKLY